jgi:hypothetical protein
MLPSFSLHPPILYGKRVGYHGMIAETFGSTAHVCLSGSRIETKS